jgi:hypothetical protein
VEGDAGGILGDLVQQPTGLSVEVVQVKARRIRRSACANYVKKGKEEGVCESLAKAMAFSQSGLVALVKAVDGALPVSLCIAVSDASTQQESRISRGTQRFLLSTVLWAKER